MISIKQVQHARLDSAHPGGLCLLLRHDLRHRPEGVWCLTNPCILHTDPCGDACEPVDAGTRHPAVVF